MSETHQGGTHLLEVTDIDVHHGELKAIDGVSLTIDEGETLAVLGANGAGKSTLLGAVAGTLPLSRGAVRFEGRSLTGAPAFRRVRMGIALTPEGRRVFPSLTVEENLLAGAFAKRSGPWDLTSVYDLFPLVADRKNRMGANLSGGEQQATAIGRALMSNPRLLLLDEVSLGLAPVAVKEIYDAIPRITERGTTILVVEQDLTQALRVAERVHCLLEGRTALQATVGDVTRDQVAAAYFGLKTPAHQGDPSSWNG